MNVSAEIRLPASAERAWEILVRWEDQARWMGDADEVRVLTREREGVGTRIAVRTRVLNVPLFTEVLEVVTWDPPRRLAMRHRSFVRGSGEWILAPDGEATSFRWTERLSLPVPLLGELGLLVYRPFMRRLMRGAMARLQAVVRSEVA